MSEALQAESASLPKVGWGGKGLWLVLGLLGALLFVGLGFDGRHHWDEAFYLHTAAHVDMDVIQDTDRERHHNEDFYVSRILHVYLSKAVMQWVGVGQHAIWIIGGVYTALMLLMLWPTYDLLKRLLGDSPGLKAGVWLTVFNPVFLYLAFKTLPEAPGLVVAVLATWALVRAVGSTRWWWLWAIASAVLLATSALLKNNMTLFLPLTVLPILLLKWDKVSPWKLLLLAAGVGVLSFGVFFLMLLACGFELEQYMVGVKSGLVEENGSGPEEEPLASILLQYLVMHGPFYACLLLAFWSRRWRDALFCGLWLVLGLGYILYFTRSIEGRYLAYSVVPMAGLIGLTVDGLLRTCRESTFKRGKHKGKTRPARPGLAMGAGLIAGMGILAGNVVLLPLSLYEVQADGFERALDRLDAELGEDQYVVLVPWFYTDYQYLRVAYPERSFYLVYRGWREQEKTPEAEDAFVAYENRYYGERLLRDPAAVAAVADGRPIVYLGFEEIHTVQNLRAAVAKQPIMDFSQQLGQMAFSNKLAFGWPWTSDAVDLTFRFQVGHYQVWDVALTAESEPEPLIELHEPSEIERPIENDLPTQEPLAEAEAVIAPSEPSPPSQ